MGWAGPPTGPGSAIEEFGPISARNGWVDIGPTLFLFISLGTGRT
jgi:hypothetical protein